MPKLSRVLVVFALLLFAIAAYSQNTVATSTQTSNASGGGNVAGQNSGSVGITITSSPGMIGGFSGGIAGGVKGRPFSADVIEETDQYLTDGNHIHHESHGKLFRDSEGRSRTETEFGGLVTGSKPFVHVQISDPVQGTFIMLDPEHKTATVHHFAERSGAATFKASPRTAQPAPAAQSGMTTPAPAGSSTRMQAVDTASPRTARQHSREDLGTMEIEGFAVKGTRFTTTIPVGEIGNDKPMTSTNERWTSDDLKMDLLTKTNSPESGQHVRKVVNIRSGDPDPLLFQVPVDYTVKDQQ